MPISKNYQISRIASNSFIIKKKTNNPNWIPKSYNHLSINEYGFYQVLNNKENSKRLFFVDTTTITPKDISKISNYRFKQTEFEIPDSFWFYPDYLFQEKEPSWMNINQAKNYYKDFDLENESRIMTELECLCLYIEHNNKEKFINDGLIPYHDKNIDISYQEFNFDNWFNPVSSSKKSKEYRKIYKSESLYQNENLAETEITSLYLTPTIGRK